MARRVYGHRLRRAVVVTVSVLGVGTANACSNADDDHAELCPTSTVTAGDPCDSPGLHCTDLPTQQHCDFLACTEEHRWCVFTRHIGCNPPAASDCPPNPPMSGESCNFASGPPCIYSCPSGTGSIFAACNGGTFCLAEECDS